MKQIISISLRSLVLGLLLLRVSAAEKPNIIFILVDDMGWSDIGCYGGEIATPHIDALAAQGVRFTQFYNTAKCMSSRACLLTGLYAQQCGMSNYAGKMTGAVTLGEVLRPAGYRTWAAGKHHGTENLYDRGFDHYYGLRDGCCNLWNPGVKRPGEPAPGRKSRVRFWCDDAKTYHPYTPEDKNFYFTDTITNKALGWLDEKEGADKPFFLYLAYTAPHYPLHAWPKDIAKYKGKYDSGYESIRKARYRRMVEMGLIDPAKSPMQPWKGRAWSELSGIELEKEKRRMEIYAAMLDRVDQNIGKVLAKLKQQGKLENTLIMFASDNGACAEETGAKVRSTKLEDFGTVASYETVGENWATVQNTPLRNWKNYSHEGGIRSPLIIRWPGKINMPGGFYHGAGHLIDIMPTLVELAGAKYPETYQDKPVTPMQGVSLLPSCEGKPLVRENPVYWQWADGGAIRIGEMKAVFWGENRQWELYNLAKDGNESNDLAPSMPEMLESMKKNWHQWCIATQPKPTKLKTKTNNKK